MAKKKLSEQVASETHRPTLKKHSVPEKSRPPEQAQYRGKSGWGGMDVYAYGVSGMLDQAKAMRGSNSGFLGKEKVMINPKDCVGTEMLCDKTTKKKKD